MIGEPRLPTVMSADGAANPSATVPEGGAGTLGATAQAAGDANPTATSPMAGPAHTDAQRELPTCANCGASVLDHYCGRCGQRLEHEIHSVWHFTREATEDLTHADSRLWGTMNALLFKPGFLTREFLEGRRVRYLPPLRLYLVLSVVFYLFVSMRRVYGQGWLRTSLKFVALASAYFIGAVITLALTVSYSVYVL